MSYYNFGLNQPYPTGLYPDQMMPITQQVPNQPQSENHFVWVQGKEGAKAYPVAPEKTVLFLDDQNPYVYRKVTDKLGRTAEFKVFKLVEEPDETTPKVDMPFVTKDEFEKLHKELEDLKESFANRQKFNGNKQGNRKALNENG